MNPASPDLVLRTLEARLPAEGLFRGKTWRAGPEPFALTSAQVAELRRIGPALVRFLEVAEDFYQSRDPALAFFRSVLDRGKPEGLLRLHDAEAVRGQLPMVLRPDLLWTGDGFRITEIDGVPGGIGMIDFLNVVYGELGFEVLRGRRLFGEVFVERDLAVVFSREAADYRPETEWMLRHASGGSGERTLLESDLTAAEAGALAGREVYRFFELWDEELGPGARRLLEMAGEGHLILTGPPKAFFEEKLLLALYRDPFLHPRWQEALGAAHAATLDRLIPFGWVLDPEPLPWHAVYPGLENREWNELKGYSREQRRLVIKVSGFSQNAWGSRGVHVGHDLSKAEWARCLDDALASFPVNPHILQDFAASAPVPNRYFSEGGRVLEEPGVVRLSPYYLVEEGNAGLQGVLAVVCPPDKKKIHGMTEATILPCREE
ncbi:MAG: hypothetical protein KGS60_07725 [Verrucomicrobia bacterium]|nr:hypothetical protein [Verrucomicrobiota bacterium]